MTEVKTGDVPTFEMGDTIRIELQVSDGSGVSKVETRFRNESEASVKSLYRSVDLGSETDTRVIIEIQVDEDLPSGDYVCEYVALTDGLGNKSLISAPGIEFHVEGNTEDRQGPALLNWSFA
jgi:hypothetical protein